MKSTQTALSRLMVLILILANISAFAQFTIPEKPVFQTSVYDYAKVLNENEKQQLEEKLIKYSDSTTTQIVVITIESLKGEDIGILTPKWGHAWGIGGTEKKRQWGNYSIGQSRTQNLDFCRLRFRRPLDCRNWR
jgi:uncharacterized protein